MRNKTKFWRQRANQQKMLEAETPANRAKLRGVRLGRRLKDSYTRILAAPSYLFLAMHLQSESYALAAERMYPKGAADGAQP